MKRRRSSKIEFDPSQPKITKFFASKRGSIEKSIDKFESTLLPQNSEEVQDVQNSPTNSVEQKEAHNSLEHSQNNCAENGDRAGDSPFLGSESGDEILSHVDVDGIVSSYQAKFEVSGDWSENSSGDELFSQLQIENLEEKATSSQNSTETEESASTSTPETSATPSSSSQFCGSASSSASFDDRHYHRNFWDAVNRVISEISLKHLFFPTDYIMINSLRSLSFDAQCLYIRLFRRKWSWIPSYKINYKELPQDLMELCGELVEAEFLEDISLRRNEITTKELLGILDTSGLISLARKLGICRRGEGRKTKEWVTNAILTDLTQPKETVLNAALDELGPAFRVTWKAKSLFNGIYALHNKRYNT
ncbi:unnamed protein product [Orchesella dallaii]|uniref:Fanconi-associated nuclease n=1 Tax=Orchesella dallaii TaxID=48710 RepID=A0ABP1RXS9_9HEXA